MTNAVRVANLGSSWTTSTRPASPANGTTGFNSDTNSLETFNGTFWQSVGVGDASSADRAAPSAFALRQNGITTTGSYWIRNSLMNFPAQVFCDMTYDGGGWMLLAYGFVANTGDTTANFAIPNLNHPGGFGTYAYNPTNRASTNGLVQTTQNQKTAMLLAKGATEMIMAAGGNPSSGGIDNYTYVYKFDIPDPGALTFANHTNQYNSNMSVSQVQVTGLKGDIGTFTRWTITESLGCSWTDTYPSGYGLQENGSPRSQTFDRGPFFPSVHSGSRSTAPGNPALQTAQPDLGVNGFQQGARSYTFRGWYGANAVTFGQTGQTSIWVR